MQREQLSRSYFKDDFEKTWKKSNEIRNKFKTKGLAWRSEYQSEWERKYDEKNKSTLIEKYIKEGIVTEKQLMPDLHATFNDAKRMYNFLANTICNDL